jgi:hypothetical protein
VASWEATLSLCSPPSFLILVLGPSVLIRRQWEQASRGLPDCPDCSNCAD